MNYTISLTPVYLAMGNVHTLELWLRLERSTVLLQERQE